MNKTHTDTHMQKPDHTRLPTYTHTHMDTHKNMRAYAHTQTLIHTGIHTNICTRTCMHTHTLSYTPTNHENIPKHAHSKYSQTPSQTCARSNTHTQAHTYASCVWAFSRQGATGVPLFTTWDSVAGLGRAPIPGNISGRS